MSDGFAIEMKVLAELEKSGFDKQVQELQNNMDTGILRRLDANIRAIDDAIMDATSVEDIRKLNKLKGEAEGQKGVASMGGVKGILGTLGKIAGGIGILVSLAGVFEKPMSMIGQVVKSIGEFLRPISDIFVMLIQPIMSMLRPLLMVLNALMRPFKEAAMKGIAASNMLIAQGTQMLVSGEEGGGSLIAEGMKGAFSSASLMLSGFVEVLFTPLMGIDFMGIGKAIQGAFDTWQSSAIGGVYRVILFNEQFSSLVDNFESAKDAIAIVDAVVTKTIGEMKKEVELFTIEEFEANLTKMSLVADEKSADALSALEQNLMLFGQETKTDASEIWVSASFMGTALDNLVGRIEENAEKINRINVFSSDMFTSSDAIKAGIAYSASSFDTSEPPAGGVKVLGPGLVEEQKTLWDAIQLLMENNVGLLKTHVEKGLVSMNLISKEYMGNSIIPETFEQGFIHMNDITTEHMSPGGKTVNVFKSAMGEMTSSVQNFGGAIKNSSQIVKSAVSDMENWAKKYHSVKRELERQIEREDRRGRSRR